MNLVSPLLFEMLSFHRHEIVVCHWVEHQCLAGFEGCFCAADQEIVAGQQFVIEEIAVCR